MDYQLLIESYSKHQENLIYFLSKIINDICDFNDPFNCFNTDGLEERLKVLCIVNSDISFLYKTIRILNELKDLNKKGV